MNEIDINLKALENFILNNPELEQLEAQLAHFNIFEAVGMVSQEIRHSHFLAFLLNPSENHRLGDIFLKRLLMKTLSEADNAPFSLIDIDVMNLSGAVVRTEWENIDIFVLIEPTLEHKSGLAVAIENKMYSGEHSDQLNRYRRIVQTKYPEAQYKHIFIFLTPDESSPSDQENYLVLGYKTVANVLYEVRNVRQSTLGTEVLTLIDHYITMLRRYIVDDSEIAELAHKIWSRHRQALELLIEHSPVSKLREATAYYINQIIDESQLFTQDASTNTNIRFIPLSWDNIWGLRTGSGWTKSGRILLFQFDNTQKYLSLTLYLGPGQELIREALIQAANTHKDRFEGMSIRPQTWKYLYSIKILDEPSIVSAISFDDIKSKIDEGWRKFLTQDLPEMSNIIENEIPWAELEAQLKRTTNN